MLKYLKSNVQMFLLYFITFVDLFAVGLVVPLISSHVLSLGGTHFIVGLMGSFYSGLQLFSSPILGSLSDISGRKPVLLTTLSFCCIAYLCFGYFSSIYVLLLLRMILGIFKHTQSLAKAYVTDVIKSNMQSEVYGKMAAISGVGITLGPLVGGHILEDHPKHGFFMVCSITSILFIANAGLVYMIKDKKNPQKEPKKTLHEIGFKNILLDNWGKSIKELKEIDWYLYWDAFLLKGLVGFSMSIFYSNYSPLLKIYYHLTPKWIGYTISFQGVIGAFSSFFINSLNEKFYMNDKNYTKRNLHCFSALTLTFFAFLICDHWYVFIVLLIPLATSNAILRLVTLEMIVRKSSEKHRGSLIGAANSIRSISGIIGPFVAGSLADLVGVKHVIIVSLLSSIVGLTISYSYRKTEKTLKSEVTNLKKRN